MEHICFVKEDDQKIAFNKENLDFFVVEDHVEDICKYLMKSSVTEASKKYNIDENDIESIIEAFSYNVFENKIDVSEKTNLKTLNRLVINLSNDCNLRCSYCYANGGRYHSIKNLMSEDVALKTLDYFYKAYDVINAIQLFGGEPLLNMSVMQSVLENIDLRMKQNNKFVIPTIGIVTNGVLIDDAFIELAKRHNLKVTISMDGNATVHDLNRIDDQGYGSYERIKSNIIKMSQVISQPEVIEITFTKQHQNLNLSIMDTIKQIRNDIGPVSFHVAPVSTQNEVCKLSHYNDFVQSVDDVFDSLEADEGISYSLVDSTIRSLREKIKTQYICDASYGTISVSIKGDIYPCFMFTDIEEFRMGNVFDEQLRDHDFINIQERFLNMNKKKKEECKDCMAQNICSGCLGVNYFETGSLEKLHEPLCDMHKKMLGRTIYRISSMYNNGM